MKVLCMVEYMVKQHNIHVHENIMQFSINLIYQFSSPSKPRDFVVQKMVIAYYSKKGN